VLLICAFHVDEPYEAAFNAFSKLQADGYELFVTGDYRNADVDPSRFPWVRFLGYLPTHEYHRYLRSVSVVMDLTTFENCLVCGAYEALAAGKPLITSRTRALESYFGGVAILADNTSDGIRAAVLSAFEQRAELAQRAKNWTMHNELHIEERVAGLRALMTSTRHRDDVDKSIPYDVTGISGRSRPVIRRTESARHRNWRSS
jgi:glycosyltransferase involved in cell wall biosynthesis